MALEDLTPAVRVEGILDGADIEPATRLEYFLSKAANEVPKPAGSSDAGKVLTVNEDGDGFELDDVPKELPAYTAADEGKFLSVVLDDHSDPVPEWSDAGVTVTLPSGFIALFQTAMQAAITDIVTNSKTGIVYAETDNFAGTGLSQFVDDVKKAAAASLEKKPVYVKGVTDDPIIASYAQVLSSGGIGLGFIVPSFEVGSPVNKIFTIYIHVSGTVVDGEVTHVKARAGFVVWTLAS